MSWSHGLCFKEQLSLLGCELDGLAGCLALGTVHLWCSAAWNSSLELLLVRALSPGLNKASLWFERPRRDQDKALSVGFSPWAAGCCWNTEGLLMCSSLLRMLAKNNGITSISSNWTFYLPGLESFHRHSWSTIINFCNSVTGRHKWYALRKNYVISSGSA